VLGVLGLVAGLTGCATEESRQSRALTIIAPAAPGGGWDQTSRTLQQVLQQSDLATPVTVVNVPGAGGTIGLAQFVNSSRGKGDVLLTMGLIMVGAVLTNQSPVALDQVPPIARLTGEFEVLVVPAASPYQTLGEWIAAWKGNPGMAIAGGSAGGTDHMLAGLLANAVGVDVRAVNYVPHSGGGESIASLVGNQVSAGINGLAELVPFIQTRQLRPLAISSADRLSGVDIPTFAEQGVDLTLSNWRGVVAPPGISGDQRQALTTLMDRLHASPAWKDALAKYNWTDMYESGPAFDAFLSAETTRTRHVLESIGLVQSVAP
jgi:putative tricarboxylic transport membrane protein